MKNFIKNILISLWSPFKPNKNHFFYLLLDYQEVVVNY
jgi:hypothetical protein